MPRFKRAAPPEHAPEIAPPPAPAIEIVDDVPEQAPIPSGWSKGALLNVRNNGVEYVVTLYPEEFDPQHPERALRFSNPATCQDFVSQWYARQSSDPRAR